jgi:hypothetical protein
MEKINKKGIPYKKDEDKKTTHVLIRVTEGLKKSIQEEATKENKTVSEMLRELALNDEPMKKPVKEAAKKEIKAVVKKEKKAKKRIPWNSIVPFLDMKGEILGYNRSYVHEIVWHDIKSEVPEDVARNYDVDLNTDGCKLLLLVKVKEDGETYLELEHGWYDAKIDRNHIVVDKNMKGKIVAYSFVSAIEPIYIFNETELKY